MVRTWPVTKTFDTLEACDVLADSFLTWPELQHEFRRYYTGDAPPHYPVPALILDCVLWDTEDGVSHANGCGHGTHLEYLDGMVDHLENAPVRLDVIEHSNRGDVVVSWRKD